MTETDPDRAGGGGRRVTLAVDSWAFEVAELPRVLPDGWTHFAVIAAGLEAHLDRVDRVDPDPEGAVASDRHRYDATVTADVIDHEHVRIVDRTPAGEDANDDGEEKTSAAGDDTPTDGTTDADEGATTDADEGATTDADGEATTEAFDVDEALDRL